MVIGYDLFRTGCYRFGVVVTFEVDDVQGLLQFGHLALDFFPAFEKQVQAFFQGCISFLDPLEELADFHNGQAGAFQALDDLQGTQVFFLENPVAGFATA